MASVVSVNISSEKGVVKESRDSGILITDFGVEGDAHGGKWHRQVSLLDYSSFEKMKAKGMDDLRYGDFAENITTEGILLYELPVGTRMSVGEALVEVTQIGKECHGGCAIRQKTGDCVMPREGIFVKVLEGGSVKKGDAIEVLTD